MNLLNILNKFGNYLLQEIIKILIILLIPILIINYYYLSIMGYIINILIIFNGLYIFPYLIEKINLFLIEPLIYPFHLINLLLLLIFDLYQILIHIFAFVFHLFRKKTKL